MTPDDLTRWEQLCDEASEGPWYMDEAIAKDGHVVMSSSLGHRIAHCYHTDVNRNDAADAEFCAAAREAMPQLIAEVRRLTEENARLSEQAHRAWQNAAQTRDILREATS